jgi:hypothetical protein
MVSISRCWNVMARRVFVSIAFPALAVLLATACGCVPAWAADDVTPLASAAEPASGAASAVVPVPRALADTNGVTALTVARDGGALLLSAQLHFSLPSAVREALTKGVPVYFIAEADVLHPRWYWTDQRLGQARRYWRISYQPLTRRWRLSVSSEPLSDEGIGTGLAQHYDSLDSAVTALQRITGWRVANAAALEGGGRQILTFSFRIDTTQLPRALQIGVAGQADWRLRIERRLDLAELLPVPSVPASQSQPQSQSQQQDATP